VVSGRLNVFKGVKRTNKIVGFGRSWHLQTNPSQDFSGQRPKNINFHTTSAYGVWLSKRTPSFRIGKGKGLRFQILMLLKRRKSIFTKTPVSKRVYPWDYTRDLASVVCEPLFQYHFQPLMYWSRIATDRPCWRIEFIIFLENGERASVASRMKIYCPFELSAPD
jgi:hypothetical protein